MMAPFPPAANTSKTNRKKVAILSSFLRLGQWRGIMRYGQRAGWICQRIDRDTLARLNTWKPDGVIFQIDEFDSHLLEYVISSKLPKVGLRALPGLGNETPLVLRDLSVFGHEIASHFVARNYRRLCYLGPKSNETANSGCTHVKGMQQVADAHGIQLECFYPDQSSTWKRLGLTHHRRSATDWDHFWEMGPAMIDHLIKDPEPVAVFSAYTEPAMEFMEMIDERDLSIPAQIGIAAQTEDALNGLVTKVPMTCLVPNHEKQSFQAAALLDEILDGRKVDEDHRSFVSEFELVLRESSNQIVTSDPLLEQMLEHVRANALNAVYTPDSLAMNFDYSLRAVQIRFRKSLGRGVAEVIREERTQHAIELISKTNLPMQEIYGKCGFSGHHQLERAVRSVRGLGPSALRKHSQKNAGPSLDLSL
jgi:DNA-binding LacI/PurR family transcriptional regulator